ncbi:hypothetical protein QE152_g31438 [Popillia japonica]|uniref:Uncharacterized protein n=1 Tax=Popillia japonica TaxID=7064 RepID=A0AAW1J153_POPJA
MILGHGHLIFKPFPRANLDLDLDPNTGKCAVLILKGNEPKLDLIDVETANILWEHKFRSLNIEDLPVLGAVLKISLFWELSRILKLNSEDNELHGFRRELVIFVPNFEDHLDEDDKKDRLCISSRRFILLLVIFVPNFEDHLDEDDKKDRLCISSRRFILLFLGN